LAFAHSFTSPRELADMLLVLLLVLLLLLAG
jgi:hypothetical protein